MAIIEATDYEEMSLDKIAANFKVIQFTCIGTKATVMWSGTVWCQEDENTAFGVSASLCWFQIAA